MPDISSPDGGQAQVRLGTWNDVEGHPEWYWGLGLRHGDGTLTVTVLDRTTGAEVVTFTYAPLVRTRAQALAEALRIGGMMSRG